MPKGDISWTRRTDDGERVEVNVRHVGDRWIFHSRERRPEQWQEVAEPPLEDWLTLLDAVKRRVGRGSRIGVAVEHVVVEIRDPLVGCHSGDLEMAPRAPSSTKAGVSSTSRRMI